MIPLTLLGISYFIRSCRIKFLSNFSFVYHAYQYYYVIEFKNCENFKDYCTLRQTVECGVSYLGNYCRYYYESSSQFYGYFRKTKKFNASSAPNCIGTKKLLLKLTKQNYKQIRLSKFLLLVMLRSILKLTKKKRPRDHVNSSVQDIHCSFGKFQNTRRELLNRKPFLNAEA